MFYIVTNIPPYTDVIQDDNGLLPMEFNTSVEAEEFAKENCAWEYRIVEF